MHDGSGKVEIIPTDAIWFGVTYKEDAPAVRKAISGLLEEGVYPLDSGAIKPQLSKYNLDHVNMVLYFLDLGRSIGPFQDRCSLHANVQILLRFFE